MTTAAAPDEYDETFHGVRLYECLTRQVGAIRHGPSGTTWVYAYRGVTAAGVPVIVFRPGPWLLDLDDVRGDQIVEDLTGHAVESGGDERCGWAAVVAPPGVRLRAIVLELAERGMQLPEYQVLDLIARTHQALPLGRTGDTFIGWDGALWLAPAFPASLRAEAPSINLGDIFDALVIDRSTALHEVLTGELPPAFSVDVLDGKGPARAALPRDISPALAEIAAPGARLANDAFYARCAEIAGPPPQGTPSADAARALGAVARGLFPDAHARQVRALADWR
jgi:hypothetical protein